MTQQIINTGTFPNDATGDPAQTAFIKINNNFGQLFGTSAGVVFGPPPFPPGGIAVTINAAQNSPALVINGAAGASAVTIVPAAGQIGLTVTTLAVSGGSTFNAANNAAAIINATSGFVSLGFAEANVTKWQIVENLSTTGRLSFFSNTTGAEQLGLSSAGNVTIAAPSSGNALTVNGTGGTTASYVNGSTVLLFQGTSAGNTGFGTNSAHDFTIVSGGTNRTTWSTSGNVTTPAPSSGVAVTDSGAANNYTHQINGSATSGQSFGLLIEAGTTSADQALAVLNQSASALFRVFGDGGTVLGNPTGGDKGLGTLNCTGLFVNGVAVTVP